MVTSIVQLISIIIINTYIHIPAVVEGGGATVAHTQQTR